MLAGLLFLTLALVAAALGYGWAGPVHDGGKIACVLFGVISLGFILRSRLTPRERQWAATKRARKIRNGDFVSRGSPPKP
jgi:hypothetical protein